MLTVRVTLLNDKGEEREEYGEGDAVQDAVNYAEDLVRKMTGDPSYCMSEWVAA